MDFVDFSLFRFGHIQFPVHPGSSPFLSITEYCCFLKSLLFICWKAPGQLNTIHLDPLAYQMLSVKGRLHILLSF